MNWNHNLRVVVITGKSGSGKSTLYLQRLTSWPARWKFAFDPDREFSRKCGVPTCYTDEQLNAAVIAQRPAAFCPAQMFPDNYQEAFAWFCRYTVEVCKRLRGVKLFCVDELWKFCPKFSPPSAFREILNTGRKEEIDQLYICQRIAQLCEDVKTQMSECITFKHTDANALAWLQEMGFDPEQIKALPYPGGKIVLDVNRDEIIANANGTAPRRKQTAPDVTRTRSNRAPATR